MNIKKIILLFAVTLFSAGLIRASQTEPTDSLIGERTPFFSPVNHSVFAGLGFGNDLIYNTSSLSDNQPFFSTDFMYAFRGNLWTALTLYNLPGQTPNIPFYDISAGYRHVFNDYLDASASFSSYHSSANLDESYYDSFQYLRLSAGLDWVYIYTRATLGRILEEGSGFYFYLKNSHFISTRNKGSENYFTFDPNINMLFGNHTQIIPRIHGGGNIPGSGPQAGGGGPGRPGGGTTLPEEEQNEYHDKFTLMRIELSVPVSWNFRDFTMEIEPLLAIPALNDETYAASNGFFIFLNAYYRIF